MEIANVSPRFKEQALALAKSWLTSANIPDSANRSYSGSLTAMMLTIDGVCLRLGRTTGYSFYIAKTLSLKT